MPVILPRHIGCSIEHNEHKMYYDSVEQLIDSNGGFHIEEWASSDEYLKACIDDELWQLTVYPDTPIGSYRKFASTFDGLLAIMAKELNDDLREYP
jgi:hypothetical protein